ncbi:MAG TPA: hypothetical protein VJQ55_11510, partial [Candidatus Binatia bacterium]|nr:hypothetical protein [Candidatus Binatia bacterium]
MLTGRVFFAIVWLGFSLASLAVKIIPRHWLQSVTDLLASVGFYCCRGFRNRSIANITAVLGQSVDGTAAAEIARGSLRNFLRSCMEIAIALAASRDELRQLIS